MYLGASVARRARAAYPEHIPPAASSERHGAGRPLAPNLALLPVGFAMPDLSPGPR